MSYAAPIIHHDFNPEGKNKGTLEAIYDLCMNNILDFVTDPVHVQKGIGSLYSGQLGNQGNNVCVMNNSNAAFTSSASGHFISLWFKHNYDMRTNPYYSKQTRAELLSAGYTEAQAIASTSDSTYATHIVNSTFYKINHVNGGGGGVTQFGYNAVNVTGNTTTLLVWQNGNHLLPVIKLGVEDDVTTDPDTIGIYDGGTDFHHLVVDYGSVNANTVKTYVDNVLLGTSTPGGLNLYNVPYYQIAIQEGKEFFDTYINDFRVYNYAADTTMIDMIYKLGSDTNVASLSGATISSLQNAGASMVQLVTAGISIADLLAGYTYAEIRAGGVNISAFIDEGVSNANMLAAGFTQTQIDIALTNIKIHSDFTISDGTNSSVFVKDAVTVYTPTTFAAKLTADLGNTVTAGPESFSDEILPVAYAYVNSSNYNAADENNRQGVNISWGTYDLSNKRHVFTFDTAMEDTNYNVVTDRNYEDTNAIYIFGKTTTGFTADWTNADPDIFDGTFIVYASTPTKRIGDSPTEILPVGYAYVNSSNYNAPNENNRQGVNISWSTYDLSIKRHVFTIDTAMEDTSYNVVTDRNYENTNCIQISGKTTTGFNADWINADPDVFDGTFILYASTPTKTISSFGSPSIEILPVAYAFVNSTNYDAADVNDRRGVNISWSTWNDTTNRHVFTFDTAMEDTSYNVVTDRNYENTNCIQISGKTTTGFNADWDSGNPEIWAGSFIVYASTPTKLVGGSEPEPQPEPFYRLYLQFANAVTLTGMPKDIFTVPFSDFSVKAGGQVNLRNVNLDASMNIVASYTAVYPFGLMTGDIDYTNYGKTAISGDGNRIATVNNGGAPSYTGSLTANGGGPNFGQINIYERDTNAASGWTQLGETIWGGATHVEYGQNVSMSHDGEIVVAGSHRNSTDYTGDLYGDVKHWNESLRGYFQAWKRDASSTVNPVGWVKYGNAIIGKVHQDRGFWVKISGDGNSIVAKCRERVNYVEVYKYSTPGQTGGTWDLQGNTFNGNTTSGHDDYYLSMNLSYDGNILAIGNSTYNSNNGRVQVYQRDTNAATGWTQLGTDIVGTGGEEFGGSVIYGAANLIIADNGNKLAVMSENYSNAQSMVVGRVSIYKRDTNVALGWSLIGNPIENPISTEKNFDTMDISEDGNRVVIGISEYDDGNITNAGRSYVYDYNSTTLAWEHIITNSQTSSTDPITGTSNNDYLSAIVISADGFKQAVRRNDKIYTYQLPGELQLSNTSTIPAGNYFINNFVSTIETDLDLPLSYDASNALIEFVGLGQDISMSITSTDATIFDTTITEITAAANTLPFITYGQPDPTISQYIDNGITVTSFISNGYTISQLFAAGIIPDWALDTDANHFDQSYVKGFVDLSGSLVIRNDNKLITNGELSLGGNLITSGTTSLLIDDMTLKSHLFMGEDISANGNVNIGGDLSINGQFSGDFADDIIPMSAIGGGGGGGINISGNAIFIDDVSFNGPTVDVTNTLQVNQIEFNDGTTVSTHDDNILSGTFAGSNAVFKDSTFAQVTCVGAANVSGTYSTSDYRIKNNITELNETDTVDALVPIQYNNTKSGNHEFGLLAHELQEVYPDLVVGEKDGAEYQRVHYNGLIGVLVKEIQGLKQRLAVLNNR